MPLYQQPAILTTPLEDLLLQMKSIGIHDILSFPFPTAPSFQAIEKAENLLLNIGALSMNAIHKEISSLDLLEIVENTNQLNSNQSVSQDMVDKFISSQQPISIITEVGKLMSKFPLNPRFSKMLVVAYKTAESQTGHKPMPDNTSGYIDIMNSRLIQFTLSLVAVLSERSPFLGKHQNHSNIEFKKEDENDDSDDEMDADTGIIYVRKAGLDNNSFYFLLDVISDKENDLSYHPYGDALARLRAFSAYAFTYHSLKRVSCNKSKLLGDNELYKMEEFCHQHHLHQPTIQRSFDLRNQLSRIFSRVFEQDMKPNDHNSINNSIDESSWSFLSPPSDTEEIALRQIIVAGYCDNIARKAPYDLIKVGSRRKRFTAYVSCDPNITGPIYIHPDSTLYHKDPTAVLPEYVLYESLMENTRGDYTYMTSVTLIRDIWIPSICYNSLLLKWSLPLSTPLPYYNNEKDCVMCYCIPKYGTHNWELPIVQRSMLECVKVSQISKSDNSRHDDKMVNSIGYRKQDEHIRWFARLLLEGKIILNNEKSKSIFHPANMKDSPSIITQMKLIPKVSNLLRSLVRYNISSKQSLIDQLKSIPSFLCDEIQEFLKLEIRQTFRMIWHESFIIK
jgi:ATP-dependent RNA helicase DHX37/DHR1